MNINWVKGWSDGYHPPRARPEPDDSLRDNPDYMNGYYEGAHDWVRMLTVGEDDTGVGAWDSGVLTYSGEGGW